MSALTIIAVLMAIAFPTFLAQKSTAQATQAKANVKQLVNAIESCAASRTDGSYSGPGGSLGCLDPAALVEMESALQQLELGSTTPQAGGYQVAPIGTDGFGYMVQGASESSSMGGPVWFAELALPDGQRLKLCGKDPILPTDRTGGDLDTEGCTGGTW